MKWDNYNLVVLEQNPEGDPGNSGDAFAESFRWATLESLKRQEPRDVVSMYRACRTPKGFVRHPDSPWREDDFSSDQLLPGYIALSLYGCAAELADLEAVLFLNHWRTGNGDLVTANFWAARARVMGRPSAFKDLAILVQAWGMKYLPYRWNDERRGFERNGESSADYLNWIMLLIHAHVKGHTWATRRALKVFERDHLKTKVLHYYAKEPNNHEILSLYEQAIDEVFK